jgi:hypothetical protein
VEQYDCNYGWPTYWCVHDLLALNPGLAGGTAALFCSVLNKEC